MKSHKVPTRTCVGCNTSSDKRSFVRIVRTPAGHVDLDSTGKANGRGTYVCAQLDCFDTACKRRRFDSTLRVVLKQDDYDRLRRDFTALITPAVPKQGE